MARRKLPLLEKAEIVSAGAEGKALAKVGGMVVFVPFAAPGDIADIQVVKKKKSYYEGRVTRFHEYSSLRTKPFCEHFGLCGGCSWQHMEYRHQLAFKRQQVIDSFQRIGKFEFPEVEQTLGSENETHYRNKLEYTFSTRRWLTDPDGPDVDQQDMNGLGFHIPRLFDRILDINTCYHQPEPSNSIRLAVKAFAQENTYDFYDHRNRKGFLRNLLIRNSNTGEFMVILVVNHNDKEKIFAMLDHLGSLFPQITSLGYVVNTKLNDSLGDQVAVHHRGKPYITEKMENLQFRIGPLSFFQTNSSQAYQLYSIAREMAALTGNEIVYDLYTGAGTIANFVAASAKKVIGIEYVEASVNDAIENAMINNISNTSFFAGDMARVLNNDFVAEHGTPDVIITDPPRAGMHENVIKMLLEMMPAKIVYVSCNPATQARDIALMSAHYKVLKVQPVDMFPHTHHIENVVLLQKH
ncbi:MAG: 23S rRNA (uracil(1939)-C(5))-methyltransferase RlmD [Bacteroidales bacterium]|nr:23S rRNA (uracil(1939)-C(5))-methyltransferase RlmD [Bacteroidales bacterium]